MTDHIIDAKGKNLGRVASQAASLLMGKNLASFARHKAPDVKVTIINASKLSLGEKKRKEKEYKRFSQYPGGLKIETMGHLADRRGIAVIVRHAVRGMIPNNKLRPLMLKRLHVSE